MLGSLFIIATQSKADVVREARELSRAALVYEVELSYKGQEFKLPKGQTMWATRLEDESHTDDQGRWRFEHFSEAFVRRTNVVFTRIHYGSRDGERCGEAEYFFRPDGSLARIAWNFWLYEPEWRELNRERIFDASGQLIHEGISYTSGDTGKKLGKRESEALKSHEPRVPNYVRQENLPYFKLINFLSE